jgi:hypothetical protein
MNKLFRATLAVALLSFIPAYSGEVGLLVDKNFGQSATIPLHGDIELSHPTGFGIRGAFTVLDLKVAELGVSATYHPKVKSDTEFKFGPNPNTGQKDGSSSYFAIGAQVDWKFLVNLHLGTELRRETISTDYFVVASGIPLSTIIINAQAGETTVTRPWINGGIGVAFPIPGVTPFMRLEVSYALKNYSLPETNGTGDDLRKALAPRYQIALYGGIRF